MTLIHLILLLIFLLMGKFKLNLEAQLAALTQRNIELHGYPPSPLPERESSRRKHKHKRKHKHRKGKKSIKFAMHDKPLTTDLKLEAKGPLALIDTCFVSKNITFDTMEFSEFVAGELQVALHPDTPSAEMYCRLNVLRRLAYHYNRERDNMSEIRDLYSDYILKIQRGVWKWGDPDIVSALEQDMLARALSKFTLRGEPKFDGQDTMSDTTPMSPTSPLQESDGPNIEYNAEYEDS